MERVVEPVRAVGDVRPGADVREPGDQGVDAVDALQAGTIDRRPVDRQPAAVGELDEDGLQQVEMRIGQRLAKIRDLAHRPQEPHGQCRRGRARAGGGEHLQTDVIERVAGAQQAARGRLGIQRLQQVLERGEVERGIAPAQLLERREIVTFDRFDRPGVEAAHLGVVPNVPSRMLPGAARDLPDLVRMQAARSRPSNLTRLAKATWPMSMFRPMPIASVAIRWSTSPAWYSATWALRARLSAPSTTAGRRGGGAPARRARTLPGR